jgi:hypothetical protein
VVTLGLRSLAHFLPVLALVLVVQGVGILEKRSKNLVAWRGSELILGHTLDPASKQEMDRIRGEISVLQKEEALLDQWSSHILKMPAQSSPMNASDIIRGLFYPTQGEIPTQDMLVDDTGKPRRAILAVHAPYDSVVYIPNQDEDSPERSLFIGTRTGLQKYEETSTQSKKRKPLLHVRKGVKVPRHEERVLVSVLSTVFDEKDRKIKESGVRLLSEEPELMKADKEKVAAPEGGVKRSASWEVAELANDAGVSEFFGSTEPVDV